MNNLTIQWNGHSCFLVACGGWTIVLDPYAPDSVPGLPPLALSANQVLCSHGHSDHGYGEGVQILPGGTNPFQIQTIDTFHDDAKGALRGPNRIHILEAEGLRIAHLGDLGCMPTPKELDQLTGLDVLMIPVGGYYTIDAAQAHDLAVRLAPRITIPMHYRSERFGYPVIGTLDRFTELCKDVCVYPGNALEVDGETKTQTAVLTLP